MEQFHPDMQLFAPDGTSSYFALDAPTAKSGYLRRLHWERLWNSWIQCHHIPSEHMRNVGGSGVDTLLHVLIGQYETSRAPDLVISPLWIFLPRALLDYCVSNICPEW